MVCGGGGCGVCPSWIGRVVDRAVPEGTRSKEQGGMPVVADGGDCSVL